MVQRLLIVADQFLLGGMETHIASQAQWLLEQGWQVHLACGQQMEHELLPTHLTSFSRDFTFTKSQTQAQMLDAVSRLRAIIKEQQITLVHAHPFNCLLPALLAAKLENVPFVFTLHGPASIFGGQGAVFEYLLLALIYPAAEGCVAVSPELAELANPYVNSPIKVLPNAVPLLEVTAPFAEVDNHRWLLASRLDQDKVKGLVAFVRLAVEAGIAHIDIAGEGSAKELLQQELLELGLQDKVTWLGFCAELEQQMPHYTGVAGMGRVVLEAMAVQKPVCLVGYDGVKGVVTADNLTLFAYANFSGRDAANITEQQFNAQLGQLGPVPSALLADYALPKVTTQYMQWIESLPLKASIDCLYLHHYLTCFNEGMNEPILDSHYFFTLLGKLLDNKHSSGPRYFYYKDIINKLNVDAGQGELLQQTVQGHQQLDQQLTNLGTQLDWQTGTLMSAFDEQRQLQQQQSVQLQQLGEQSKKLMDELMNIKSKRSFVARLGRLSKLSAQSIYNNDARYELAKMIYWRLPASVRQRLVNAKQTYVSRQLAKKYNQGIVASSTEQAKPQLKPWLAQACVATKVAVVPCAFEFDELVNQRPINAAKYLAKEGYLVIYVVWQWQASDQLTREQQVHPNVWQVPLYEFLALADAITPPPQPSLFLMTFPAAIFMPAADVLRKKSFALVYDIMDEWQAFSLLGQAPWYDEGTELELINKADLVTCVSPPLQDKFAHLRQDIMVSGNGYTASVNGEQHYLLARHNRSQASALRVGYFGHLTDAWFDWELILTTAEQRPELTFDIIGYGEPEWVIKRLEKISNVILHGKIPPADLHRYVKDWAVALIPFKAGTLAQAVDPIKIYEYLFYGLPTVVTGISFLASYPSTYVADNNGPSFIAALDAALADQVSVPVLEEFLAKSTWDALFSSVLQRLESSQGLRSLYE